MSNSQSAPSSVHDAENSLIAGKYRLVNRLGEGGMAVVWHAHNIDLDAPVALKLCKPELLQGAGLAARLFQEAKAVARLNHPNIIRVFDTGATADGAPYIVMELLEGHTLGALLDTPTLPDLAFVVRVMVRVADALSYAHNLGVVHRDIKPENIFLVRDESGVYLPKILDWGIVKVQQEDAHLTQTGLTLGSPAYMAPEQAAGESDVDGRADIWAACVVLFEALTGRMPFTGDNYNAVMRNILLDPVPSVLDVLREQGQPLSPLVALVAEVVDRGLRKPRHARWQTAAEFADVLDSCLVAAGSDNSRVSRSSMGFVPTEQLLPVGARDVTLPDVGRSAPVRNFVGQRWVAAASVLAVLSGGLWWHRTQRAAPENETAPAVQGPSAFEVPAPPPVAAPATVPLDPPTQASAESAEATAVSAAVSTAPAPGPTTVRSGAARQSGAPRSKRNNDKPADTSAVPSEEESTLKQPY